ncbi:MAG: hypothetical protein JRI68_31560 [Deltaproteobacteria bacterium]|nr:hypothetical protein [Deltaproteobacteria bacterium]
MRKIRLIVSRAPGGGWPVLVLAALVPAGTVDCGSDVVYSGPTSSGQGGDGGTGGVPTTTSTATGGEGGTWTFDAGVPDGYGGPCDNSWEEDVFTVPVPSEGVPANPSNICPATSPVESNDAAHVTLVKYSQSLHLASGLVTVDPSLLGQITALSLEVVTTQWYSEMADMQVSNVQPAPQGFTFHAQWPEPFNIPPDVYAQMKVRTIFNLQCPGNVTQLVHAHTWINLCVDDGGEPMWVSSGDECTTCSQVCEMAPGPIAPTPKSDPLPLARALRLGLKEVARIGHSSVLLAEHDGGPDLEYRWEASAGEVKRLAPDLVVWTRPARAGCQHLRVAALAVDAVAVASFSAV